MRIIKFRGRILDNNGECVYGHLLQFPNASFIVTSAICDVYEQDFKYSFTFVNDLTKSRVACAMYPVDPHSIVQLIGI